MGKSQTMVRNVVQESFFMEIFGSSEFPMGKSQTMVKNVVQESFFMEIFK